jgi:hypothetical protein
MPRCSRCASNNTVCIVSSDSRKCASCVRSGRHCDLSFSASVLERLNREEERLKSKVLEEEDLLLRRQSELEELQRRQQESLSRIRRLRRQTDDLRQKGSEMLRRGLESLEELEALERREEEEKRSSEAAAASTSAEPSAGKSLSSVLYSFANSFFLVEPAIASPGFELPPDFDWLAVEFDPALFALGSPLDPGASGGIGQSSQGNSTNA